MICSRSLAAALLSLVAAVAPVPAQTHWTVDPKASLAWWQMSPNLSHLWATTCPADPSWRPGENRSGGWVINPRLKLPSTGYANIDDTVHVPLFPRVEVQPDCVEAIRGDVVVPDTVHWRGVRGTVQVLGEALVTGQAMRDVMMHQVMQTTMFPEIQFTLDSLVDLTKRADTLVGNAIGVLTIRGVQKSITAALKAFPDAGGLRVLAKWRFPAPLLLLDFTPKLSYMGLGANTLIWHDIFMGADLVFRAEAPTAN
jgi:hypothetical protein